MKTKHFFSHLVLVCCLFFAVAQLMPGTVWAKSKSLTLRWAEQSPPKGVRPEVVKWMGSEIEKRTQGRIKIEMHWGSSLVKRKEMLRGTMIGTCDIGTLNVAFHPSQLRTWGIFNTFMMGPSDPDIVSWVKRTCFDTIPAFNTELEKWNQRWITFFNYLPSALSSTKPLTSITQLKGQRMRAPSAWLLAMLKGVGATPVSMPWGEVYVALQRGTIDGVLTSLDSYYRYSMDEVAKHYLYNMRQWQPQPVLITINMDTWKRIDAKDQEIILQTGKEANAMENRLNQNYWDECMNGMKQRSNAIFTEMSKAEIEEWANKPGVKGLPEKWVEDAKKAGTANAQEIMDKVQKIVNEGLAKEAGK